MKLPPASTKRPKIARLCSRSAPQPQSGPKVIVPSASSETRRPLRPRISKSERLCVVCMVRYISNEI